jgi:hypothetical protein
MSVIGPARTEELASIIIISCCETHLTKNENAEKGMAMRDGDA